MTETTSTVTAVDRAAAILSIFAASGRPVLGVTEISQELGLSKAVVHRVLASLKSAGFVDTDRESRKYRLGPAALSLGQAYLEHLDLRSLARQSLESLAEATGETATLSIRNGAHDRVYVDQVTPRQEVKMTVTLGRPHPLHAGSSSKAFLAFLPPDEIADYLATQDLARLTEQTITDAKVLETELERVRKRGYSRSFGERMSGAGSVAAPVFDSEGSPVAAMSICGPIERFRPRAADLAVALLEETRGLSARLGFQ